MKPSRRRTLSSVAAASLALQGLPSLAADGAATPIVVTATRSVMPAFELPVSIDRFDADAIRDAGLQVSLVETLGTVPGLMARDRQNHAQDVQISVRGFGARSTFGIRGVRVYVDGIPATMPDGQGQLSNIDLTSAERIEVMRGPFSALYGNSSGGVIQVFTEQDAVEPEFVVQAAAGSDGLRRIAAKARGPGPGFSYVVSASHLETDGYRAHSAARRQLGNARLSGSIDADTRYSVVANSVAAPAQDPLGLTRAQLAGNPRTVDPVALTFDTRKDVDQVQLGATIERRLGNGDVVRALLYGGQRSTIQFQAIPAAAQGGPLHAGGVIVLDRDYRGADLRWTAKRSLAGQAVELTAGLALDDMEEHRRGHQNFDGARLGVIGALRRDEVNGARNADQYAQLRWQPGERFSVHAGVRRNRIRFVSDDRYIVGANPDDSGSVRYGATLPVLGAVWAATPDLRVYATAGRGFETPTLNETAYRPDGSSGPNFTLRAARSDNVEAGVKARSARWGTANVALFETRTRDEVVTLSNVGGRSTFRNAGSTRRRGVEGSWHVELSADLRAQLALTWLDAAYREDFMTCAATPCATPTLRIAAGNRIPGIARETLYGALAWRRPEGWRARLEVRAAGSVAVNDANTDAAPGYAVAGASVGYETSLGRWTLGTFLRADNLFGRRYAGSVIVNEGNGRFFEPAAGRTWAAGLGVGLRL
jgi:iron complex outermembrane recepter protein